MSTSSALSIIGGAIGGYFFGTPGAQYGCIGGGLIAPLQPGAILSPGVISQTFPPKDHAHEHSERPRHD